MDVLTDLPGFGVVAGDVVTLKVLEVLDSDTDPPLGWPLHAAIEMPSATTPPVDSSRCHQIIGTFSSTVSHTTQPHFHGPVA